jgi:GMP synthase (glutamine-hydrolysing)
MKKATIVQHVSFEDLGSFEKTLVSRGFELRYLLAGRDSLAAANLGDPDLAVFLGGPISVNDTAVYSFIKEELQFLSERLNQRRPTLGICLGAQLMCRALGGHVQPMQQKEITWSRLEIHGGESSILASLEGFPVMHWHGEQFSIPASARLLASTPLCPHQAFAVDDFALGLQFHPEVTRRGLELWYVGHCAELAQAEIDIGRLRRDAEEYGPALENRGGKMLSDWLDRCRL